MKKIFNYLLLSAAAMTAMLAVSCDPTEQEDPTTEEPSQEQLVVPEGELIAFEKITPAEITMRSISATFEAEGDCAKIIRGFCLPNENNIIDWDSASDDEIVNVLKDLAMTNTPYYWTRSYDNRIFKSYRELHYHHLYGEHIQLFSHGKQGNP